MPCVSWATIAYMCVPVWCVTPCGLLYCTGAPISGAELNSEVALFWLAGFETTAHSIAWALFLVATHPQVEQALTDELAAAGLLATAEAPKPRALAWDDLTQVTGAEKSCSELS